MERQPVKNKANEIEFRKTLLSRPMNEKAKDYFLKPADICQFCGQQILDHQDPKVQYWQRKWSIHEECRISVEDQLDRSIGIKTERKSRG